MSPTAPLGDDPLVELVDTYGSKIGTTSKGRAHSGAGQMHRAFSVVLIDQKGQLLLQRRSATKYHSAGLWSNACCGHPYPGEEPSAAAIRRTREELGATLPSRALVSVGSLTYALIDGVSGVVEREYNHLFVGWAPITLNLNHEEVAEVAFVPLDALEATLNRDEFTAWFPLVLDAARPSLSALLKTREQSRRP